MNRQAKNVMSVGAPAPAIKPSGRPHYSGIADIIPAWAFGVVPQSDQTRPGVVRPRLSPSCRALKADDVWAPEPQFHRL